MDGEHNGISFGMILRRAETEQELLAVFFKECIERVMREFDITNANSLLTAEIASRLIAVINISQKPAELFDCLCNPFIKFLQEWEQYLARRVQV